MQQHETEFLIGVMCDVFAVSRSGYYAWRKNPVSKRKQASDKLLKEIRTVHHESRETYGSPRVYQALKQQDIPCSENRIARLMQEDGLRAKSKRRFKATTNSKHDLPVAPNLLQRDFSPEKPDQVWAGDITYIWTAAGWLYLAVVLDLFSRSVVGWAMEKRMTRSGHGCPDHGGSKAQAFARADLPFGPLFTIRQRGFSIFAGQAPHALQYESQGRLLGQRPCRKFLWQPEAGAGISPEIFNPFSCPTKHFRLY